MTTAVATKETFKPPLAVGGRIVAIVPQDIEQVFRLASAIAAADMAPKAYNRDANRIMVGIMHGMEVGFPPMAALQSIAVINGMPSIWGDGALGLVRGSGLLDDFKETIEGEGDEAKAVCWVKRKGEEGMAREFSVADAKKAELWGKKGPWQTYPKRMLQMRARSWALRDGFADVLRGLHIAEEAQDMGELYQAADGSYVPADRPLREHYTQQAEVRQQAAETDPPAQGEDFDKRYSQTLADETESASGGTEGQDPQGEARAEQGRETVSAGASDASTGSVKAPAPEREGADSAGQRPFLADDGHAILYDGAGKELNSYERAGNFFKAVMAQIPKEKDPRAFVEANARAANHFVSKDEALMDVWHKCTKAAADAEAARDSVA